MRGSASGSIAIACAIAIVATACGNGASRGGAAMGGSSVGGAAAGGMPGDDPEPQLTTAERATLETLHYDVSPPRRDPSNRFADDAAARAFGKRLFFDTSLSGPLLERDNDGSAGTLGLVGEPGRVSCAGCHLPQAGFVDVRSPHRQISLGSQWTRRRTPALLDRADVSLYNWDGRRDTLWGQAIGVMESPLEFNSSRLFVAEQIFRSYRREYEAIFAAMPALDDAARFPQIEPAEAGCKAGPEGVAPCRGKPGDNADYDGLSAEAQREVTTVTVNVAKALAAYIRQLRCGPSRFDRWLDGDAEALSRSELRGAALFVGRAGCVDCHSGPNLTDEQFHNVGLRPGTVAVAFTDSDDRGAAEGIALALEDPLNSEGEFSDGDRGVLPLAVGPELEGAFRTPTLRCVAKQPSFMHTAQYGTLQQVVEFFSRGGDTDGFPGTSELVPLDLSAREQDDLVAFIEALQGSGPDESLLGP